MITQGEGAEIHALRKWGWLSRVSQPAPVGGWDGGESIARVSPDAAVGGFGVLFEVGVGGVGGRGGGPEEFGGVGGVADVDGGGLAVEEEGVD